MSQFRIEKRRVEVNLTLAGGRAHRGHLFLAGSTAQHQGPELAVDLLNDADGVFPFESADRGGTVMVNREHVVVVRLVESGEEARLESGYDVATVRHVTVTLTNGERLSGTVHVYLPEGRDRLSDFARSLSGFYYLETVDGTVLVNARHVVELSDVEGRS